MVRVISTAAIKNRLFLLSRPLSADRFIGKGDQSMSNFKAATMSPELKSGSAIAIKGDAFSNDDTLDVHLSTGHSIQARIESVGVSHLTLVANGQLLECHPWRIGDRSLPNNLGPTSNWLVQ